MIGKPDQLEYHAIYRLSSNEDWKIVQAYIERELQTLDKDNRTEIEEVNFRRRQGALISLSTLVECFEEANEVLHRYHESSS